MSTPPHGSHIYPCWSSSMSLGGRTYQSCGLGIAIPIKPFWSRFGLFQSHRPYGLPTPSSKQQQCFDYSVLEHQLGW